MQPLFTAENKVPVGIRLSREAVTIIQAMARRLGISRAAVVEMAIRALNDRLNEAKWGRPAGKDGE